jgi:signal transduction histidine kinase
MRPWNNLSLRARLTALSVGLLAALLGALGGGLYLNLRRFLLDGTARRLRAQAKPVIEREFSPAVAVADQAAALSRALTSRDTNALVFDRQGRPRADGRRLPEEPAAAPVRPGLVARALAGEKELTYTTRHAGVRALVALIPLRPAPGGPGAREVLGAVQLTTPLQPVDALLSRQRRILGLGVAGALAAGVIGELWLTGAALRPLERVIAGVRRLAAGDLAHRVPAPTAHDEVGALAAAVNHMAGSLEETFAAQSRFVSAAAHELRTPLTALQGSVEVLQRGAQSDPAAARRLLQGMHSEVTRLSRLTEQLLALTRLDAPGALRPQPLDLPAFMDALSAQLAGVAVDRHLRLARGPAARLWADPDWLTQVFFDLTDNAVQHTAPGATLELGWQAADGAARLWLADTGEGIDPADQPHIFDAFYRGDRSRSRRRGGAGLGLAVVRSVVAAHGGTITLESQPGQGTRFTLTLPLEQ